MRPPQQREAPHHQYAPHHGVPSSTATSDQSEATSSWQASPLLMASAVTPPARFLGDFWRRGTRIFDAAVSRQRMGVLGCRDATTRPTATRSRDGRVRFRSRERQFLALLSIVVAVGCTFVTLAALHDSINNQHCLQQPYAGYRGNSDVVSKSLHRQTSTWQQPPGEKQLAFALQPSPPSRPAGSMSMSYATALTVLRCFTTPGCFRSLKCRDHQAKPLRISRRKKWEEQAFCTSDLMADARALRQRQALEQPMVGARAAVTDTTSTKDSNNATTTPADDRHKCLVYSFGIHTSWEWEEKVANLFGCHVYAFDPTMTYPTNLAPGVTFYPWGLQGAGTNMSATHSAQYDAIASHRLFTLDEITHKLGHVNRTIDVLMMDCEGCEWGVLTQLYCNSADESSDTTNHKEAVQVNQLVIELHFQKNLGILDESDVVQAALAVQCLDEARWGIVSHEKSGIDLRDADYLPGMTKVLHGVGGGFLLNLALRRIPETELLSEEQMALNAALSKDWDRARLACQHKYKRRIKNIQTKSMCPEFHQLNIDFGAGIGAYQRMNRPKAAFDNPERLDEERWIYPSEEAKQGQQQQLQPQGK